MKQQRGRLIAFEGGDGSGKATQSKLLADKLGAKLISFPRYKTEIGEAIRGNITGEWAACKFDDQAGMDEQGYNEDAETNALARQALFLMDRYDAAPEIERLLASGTDIVLDRYWPSGVIFGADDGLDKQMLIRAHMLLPQPDVWFLLDVDVEESMRRRPERRDDYEKDVKGAKRRRQAYRELFAYRRNMVHKGSCPAIVPVLDRLNRCTCDVKWWCTINGGTSIEDVHDKVIASCRTVFGRDLLKEMK